MDELIAPLPNRWPAPNFEWSFSFGNGFLGTDLLANDLYVTAYFVPILPDSPPGLPVP